LKRLFLYSFLFICLNAYPRAGSGGGGGHSFGGGGSYGGGYHGYGGHYGYHRPLSHTEVMILVWGTILVFSAILIYAAYITYLYRNKGKINKRKLKSRFKTDPFWDYEKISAYTKTFYVELQNAWTKGDLRDVQHKISPRLYRNYTGILNRYKRRGLYNIIEDIDIRETAVIYFDDYSDNDKDSVAMLISGEMKDYFSRSGSNKNVEKAPFKDAFVFIRKNNELILDEILNEPDFYQLTKPENYIQTS
jgi:hypothetical protein